MYDKNVNYSVNAVISLFFKQTLNQDVNSIYIHAVLTQKNKKKLSMLLLMVFGDA